MAAPVAGEGAYGLDVRVGGLRLGGSGNPLNQNLHDCLYSAIGTKKMVKIAPHSELPSKYLELRRLLNPTMLSIDGFFTNAGQGYLILEPADETFKEWVETTDVTELFIQTTTAGKVRLSPLLRAMLLKLAGLIDDLLAVNSVAAGLGMKDLYIKNKIGGIPTLKVLLDYNVIPIQSNADITSALAVVGGIIDWCCRFHMVQLDDSSRRFRNYFGQNKSALELEKYPDAWSDEEKTSYIFMILQGDKDSMRNDIRLANVDWPWDKRFRGRTQFLQIVGSLRTHAARLKKTYYGRNSWSYIQMCRNLLKSFEIPPGRKKDIPDRTAFLRKMEQWNPKIWTSLYEKIGPLEGGKL